MKVQMLVKTPTAREATSVITCRTGVMAAHHPTTAVEMVTVAPVTAGAISGWKTFTCAAVRAVPAQGRPLRCRGKADRSEAERPAQAG